MNRSSGTEPGYPLRKISLLSEFGRFAPNRVFFAILMGMVSGCLYALAIPLILSSLLDPNNGMTYAGVSISRIAGIQISHIRLAEFFLVFCVTIVVTRAAASIIVARVSMELSASLRGRLCERIVQSAYPQLEAMGQERLTVAITDDVRRVIEGAEVLPQLLVNGVMLLGTFSFLAYIDTHVFAFILEAMAFGVISFYIPILFANRNFRRARRLYDTLERGVRGLILGVKELQLNREKRQGYFEKILRPCDHELLGMEKRAITLLLTANSYGDLLFFFAIGAIMFIFVNYHEISGEDLVAIVMVLLYITSPVAVILNFLPRMSVASVSLNKIGEILGELQEQTGPEHPIRKRPWQDISFEAAAYRHCNDKANDGFTVGPLDFTVHKDEITFIVGGNGSGKSTLCKMLSLHYPATEGNIRFGDHVVHPESVEDLRQDIATIFSDYYLFDRILAPLDDAKLEIASRYLCEFAIDHKVQIKDGIFSTTNLSDGQRKRLALVVSFIDDKELYLLDEWAADQDPVFKKVFYTQILTDLRARGKAVVVVSHDDRYFYVADQLLVMEDGKIVEKRRGKGSLIGNTLAS